MGDPRKFHRRYDTPSHPWQAERIEAEKSLIADYGLKNKRELYRAATMIKTFTSQAKTLIASTGAQADVEKQQLFARLARLGLIRGTTNLDDVLGLQTRALLDRRLQTMIFRKGIARSPKQARQFVSHEHVMVGGKVITAPGHIVTVDEENTIAMVPHHSLASADHPERIPIQKKAKKPAPRREMRGRDNRRGGRR